MAMRARRPPSLRQPDRHPGDLKARALISTITGFQVQPNKAIVGMNAFAHETGIHQDGVLKNAQTYEIMRPEDIGLFRSNLVMGKHSGRHAFKKKLEELGYDLGENALNDAFIRFKALADKKKEIFDEDLVALVDDEIHKSDQQVRFVSLYVQCGSKIRPTAELELEVEGVRRSAVPTGDGPVDATFKAIRQIFPHEAGLALFQIHAVTEGTDAQAEVTVRLEEGGKLVTGQAADTDTLVAAAQAYLAALNRLVTKREKTARRPCPPDPATGRGAPPRPAYSPRRQQSIPAGRPQAASPASVGPERRMPRTGTRCSRGSSACFPPTWRSTSARPTRSSTSRAAGSC